MALVYAQFAARISLSGSSHQWGSRLTNPKIGLGLPAEARVPDLIVVGLIVAGGLFFLGLLMFHREALENER